MQLETHSFFRELSVSAPNIAQPLLTYLLTGEPAERLQFRRAIEQYFQERSYLPMHLSFCQNIVLRTRNFPAILEDRELRMLDLVVDLGLEYLIGVWYAIDHPDALVQARRYLYRQLSDTAEQSYLDLHLASRCYEQQSPEWQLLRDVLAEALLEDDSLLIHRIESRKLLYHDPTTLLLKIADFLHRAPEPWHTRSIFWARHILDKPEGIDDSHGDLSIPILMASIPTEAVERIAPIPLDSHRSEGTRARALEALMRYNPVRFTPLAKSIVKEPLPRSQYKHSRLFDMALSTLFADDPETYRPIVESVLVGPASWYARHAYGLLQNERPWAQATYSLRVVREGKCQDFAEQMVTVYLEHNHVAFEERIAVGLECLAHKYRKVRNKAVRWLLQQDLMVGDRLLPLLAHHAPAARSATARALFGLWGDQSRPALHAWLRQETNAEVRQIIVDLVGPVLANDPIQDRIATIQKRAMAPRKRPLSAGYPWFDVASAPPLYWATGAAISREVMTYLLECQARQQRVHLDETIIAVRDMIDLQHSAAFFAAFREARDRALKHCGFPKKIQGEWASSLAFLAAFWGDRPLIELTTGMYALEQWRRGVNHLDSFHEAVMINGSDGAVGELLRTLLNTDEFFPVLDALRGWHQLGKLRHLTKDESADRALLADPLGRLSSARLNPQFLIAHLDAALSTGRSWPIARWRQLFLTDGPLHSLAPGLCWRLVAPGGDAQCFQVTLEGQICDSSGKAIALPHDAQVRLVHPLELDVIEREVWHRALGVQGSPPIPQFDRPTFNIQDNVRDQRWFHFAEPHLAWFHWYDECPGITPDQHRDIETFWREFPRDGVRGLALLGERQSQAGKYLGKPILGIGFAPLTTDFGIEDSGILAMPLDDPRMLPLSQVPPIAFSEFVLVAERAAGRAVAPGDFSYGRWTVGERQRTRI